MNALASFSYESRMIPTPERGEHIYSALGRYYLFSGIIDFKAALPFLSEQYTRNLLRPLVTPKLLIDEIADATDMDRVELVQNHTLNPYTSMFMEPIIADPPPERLNSILGTNQWRWCEHCVDEDRVSLGWPIFYTQHQLPGVFHCAKHQTVLIDACSTCGTSWRSISHLPCPPANHQCPSCNGRITPPDKTSDADLQWLSNLSQGIFDGSIQPPSISTVSAALKHYIGFENTGHLSIGEKNRLASVHKEISQYWDNATLEVIFKSTASHRVSGSVLSKYLYTAAFNPSVQLAPAIYLMLVRPLFEDFDGLTSYCAQHQLACSHG